MRISLPFPMLAVWMALAAPLPAPAQSKITIPDGEGKATVEKVCSECHGLDRVKAKAQSRGNWIKTVKEMVGYGAGGSDQELDAIVEYLAANFGEKAPTSININKASVVAMTKFFGISPDDAESVIEYREKNGDFKVWADLEKVTGLDLKKIEAKKDQITF